jgi:hypothetical protein
VEGIKRLTDYSCRAIEVVEGLDIRWALSELLSRKETIVDPLRATRSLDELLNEGRCLIAWRENEDEIILAEANSRTIVFDCLAEGNGRNLMAAAENLREMIATQMRADVQESTNNSKRVY